ncbi:MAG: adenylate/guanylate cyclase domain-containing protein [Mycobacterium sp.]
MLILLVTSIASVAVVGFVELHSGATELRVVVSKQLIQLRETQRRAVQSLFSELTNSLIVYSRGFTATDAVQAFTAGFDELADAKITPEQQHAVADYYRNGFIRAMTQHTGDELDLDALLPVSTPQKYLQAHYTAPFRVNDANKPADAGDGSAWSAAGARFNDYFSEIVTRNGYRDALLLDTRGNVVYSVNKGPDLGTNILTGPYRESNLRDAYRKALGSNAVNFVWITDYQPYQPHLDTPTAWLVSPVGTKGAIAGVLALPLPSAKINGIMTANQHWDAAEVGKTTETFLAGPDNLMRSDSRLFLQDPQAYRREAVAAGTSVETVDKALRLGSTTLVQPLDGAGEHAARDGQTGTVTTNRDYLGQRELQAYAPLDIPNSELQWSILATRNHSDAYAGIAAFSKRVVLTTTAIIFAICVLAMLLARVFLRPIRRLQAAAAQISAGDYNITIPTQAHDEIGDLTSAFNEMGRSLQTKEKLLNEQRSQNDQLLLSLMPESVVRRYREGEQTIAQEHRNVSLVYAELLGIDEVSASLSGDELVAMVDALFSQFDSAAETCGVERIRTMYNGYLAGCGMMTPRLDNVHRTVEFTLEMERIVDRFNGRTGHELSLWAGINIGQVVSGLVGRSSVVYDLWGSAVSLAYRMRSGTAQPGIYVTAAVYDMMRDSRQFTPADPIVVGDSEQPTWRLSDRP